MQEVKYNLNLLDPVFILLLHQGAAGAAWATIIGNFFAVLYYIAVFLKGRTSLSIAPHDFKPSARISDASASLIFRFCICLTGCGGLTDYCTHRWVPIYARQYLAY